MIVLNGNQKIITIEHGITTINVIDIYSEWKKWLQIDDNAKYLPAFKSIGGEEIGGGIYLSPTYFLLNGWRIRPYEGKHTLYVNGNLFVEEGGSPFISTIGNFNVLINLNTSNIVNTVNINGGTSGISTSDKDDIVNRMKPNLDFLQNSILDILTPKINNILGLLQHNFRLSNHKYNSKGNLTSANIYIYATSDDCEDNINPLTSYDVSAIYNNEGQLIDYRVKVTDA